MTEPPNLSPARPSHVLVVDDDPDAAAEMGEYLAHRGFDTRVETSPGAAFDTIIEDPEIGVVVSDLRMPGWSGTHLMERIESVAPHRAIRFVFVSGNGTIEEAVGAMRKSAVDFLQKPIRLTELKAAVERALLAPVPVPVEEDPPGESPEGVERDVPVDLRNVVRRVQMIRRDRVKRLGEEFSSGAPWDMLLFLFEADLTGANVSVTSLCYASGVAQATALRRLAELEAAGFIARRPDPHDRRRTIVVLTEDAVVRLREHMMVLAGGVTF